MQKRYAWISILLLFFSVAPLKALAAEDGKEHAAAVKKLVTRLDQLNHLPDGQWKSHPGDLTHGESPELNDSTWPVASKDEEFSNEAVWFRQWVEVPKRLHGYDLVGARIWFRFRTGENVPQIVYLNGRRVALGEDLEPIVLFERAQPGERVLIAVKLLATAQRKRYSGTELRIDFSADRPSPEDLKQELLSAEKLIPSLSHHPDEDAKCLARAISEVDLEALDSGDQQKFDESLRRSAAALDPLKPVLQEATFHLTGNSHIDAAWLWPWTETVDVVRRTFSSALQLMNEYPGYTYTQSAAVYNDWIAQKYPEMDREIRKRIQEGRWEIVGGMWVEPDLNIPDGESTARSLLIGKRWYRDHYGVDVRIGWNPDSFGYNWQLPQIYKKSGIDYFVTQKMSWSDTNQFPMKLFWWQSPDGSKVLTYFPHGYASTDLNPARLSGDLAETRAEAPGLLSLMDLYGVGDHGGGPTRSMLDEGVHWMEPGRRVPKMQFGTALGYLSSVEKQLATASSTWNYAGLVKGYQPPATPSSGQVSIPTWNDELYLEYHRGVFTTQAAIKRNLRQSPVWTLNAEKYASLAWLRGEVYPQAELTSAWKAIAFNGFHDIAAGSGVGVIYKDSEREFEQVRRTTSEVSGKALGVLAADVDTRPHQSANTAQLGRTAPILIWNALAWQRSGIVTVDLQMPESTTEVSVIDDAGRTVPSEVVSRDARTNRFRLLIATRDVPAMGYQVLQAIAGKLPFQTDLHAKGMTLENEALRVTVDPTTGCISSLYHKKSQFEALTLGSCGNELQAFKDTPKEYDAWNIDPGTLDQSPMLLHRVVSVKLLEEGPVRASIEVKQSWGESSFIQNIVLYSGADHVTVENEVDWKETHVLLKAAFSLSAFGPYATYEIPYGTIQRPTTRNNSWEKTRFEVPALRWADLGDSSHGFSLLNDSKYGYDAVGRELRLSLLRSPTYPDAEVDRGLHHFRYALYPHAGDWRQAMTIRRGYEFNEEMQAMPVQAHAGNVKGDQSFLSVDGDNVVLTAMKKAEDENALIFHLYEWAGKTGSIRLHVPVGAIAAIKTNLLEQSEGGKLTLEGDSVWVPVKPFEIVSVRVDYSKK